MVRVVLTFIEFADQDAAADAVRRGQADASGSTAIGNQAYLRRVDDRSLVSVIDRPASPRGPVAVGAFAFNQRSTGLISSVDRALESYLGSPEHLRLMARFGFTADQLEPIL
jgi:polar amino acid transport system substrate-binding protein